jgi:hypothetical protein
MNSRVPSGSTDPGAPVDPYAHLRLDTFDCPQPFMNGASSFGYPRRPSGRIPRKEPNASESEESLLVVGDLDENAALVCDTPEQD